MGSFTRSTAPLRLAAARVNATTYVERIAEDAESAADAAEHLRIKVARASKAQRRLTKSGGER